MFISLCFYRDRSLGGGDRTLIAVGFYLQQVEGDKKWESWAPPGRPCWVAKGENSPEFLRVFPLHQGWDHDPMADAVNFHWRESYHSVFGDVCLFWYLLIHSLFSNERKKIVKFYRALQFPEVSHMISCNPIIILLLPTPIWPLLASLSPLVITSSFPVSVSLLFLCYVHLLWLFSR